MIKAKARPEIWEIFAVVFLVPQIAPKKRKTIQRKWSKTITSARIL
jgi:hypothetical protein